MEMKAAVTRGIGEPFQIEDVELAAPKDDEILVKIAACGVCHTDEAAQTNAIPVPLPAVLGHEGCGVVQAVGKNVREFQPGDKVGMSFGFCGTCRNCRSGQASTKTDFVHIHPPAAKLRLYRMRIDSSSFVSTKASNVLPPGATLMTEWPCTGTTSFMNARPA